MPVCFAFTPSLSLFVGERACPSRCIDPLHPHNHCKKTIVPCSAPTFPKPHYPSPCTTTLASLVKGEVLSPEKIRATTGGIASPPSLALHQPFQNCTIPCPAPPHLPPLSKVRCCRPKNSGDYRRDCLTAIPCTNPLEPALSLENSHHPRLLMNALPVSHPHYPLPRTTTLASLVKGRWIDGKAQTVALLRFTCDTPAFFNLPNLSAVKTEGLHSVSTIILIGGIWSGSQPPDVL